MTVRTIFWMVWREGSPTTQRRHHKKASALAEAERLAGLNPGECFYVLKTTEAVMAELLPARRLNLELKPDDEGFPS